MSLEFCKVCEDIFFTREKHLLGPFSGFFMEISTFLIFMKNPLKGPNKCFSRIKKISSRLYRIGGTSLNSYYVPVAYILHLLDSCRISYYTWFCGIVNMNYSAKFLPPYIHFFTISVGIPIGTRIESPLWKFFQTACKT